MRWMSLSCYLIGISVAFPQQYSISTIAGGGAMPSGIPAATTWIRFPTTMAADASGNLYIGGDQTVYRIDTTGVLTVIAGTSGPGGLGDGGPATTAHVGMGDGVAIDAAGNVFLADITNQRVRKIGLDGTIVTLAGTGVAGYSGDGGPATDARLNYPSSIAVDTAGNLIIADSGNNRIRQVRPDGVITTIAGTGASGFSGDGGPAASARLASPNTVLLDGAGGYFIADRSNNRVRRVSADGTITTVAGDGAGRFAGDGGMATAASLFQPDGLAVDSLGNLYIADSFNQRIRVVVPDGVINTVAGNGQKDYSGDGGLATDAALRIPGGLAMDPEGNLYIADYDNQRVRKVSTDSMITTIAGDGTLGYAGDGGPAVSGVIGLPYGVAMDSSGNVYFADGGDYRVSRVSASGDMSTIAGDGTFASSGDGGAAALAELDAIAMATDAAGNLYLVDGNHNKVRMVSPDGMITTVAGAGTLGYSGDGGLAVDAELNYPAAVAVDPAGNLYIADEGNQCVRKVSSVDGTITTIAGTGVAGTAGDGGLATSAQLSAPYAVAVDGAGNVYIGEISRPRVRKISTDGIITTVAGTGVSGSSGDGGPATRALLSQPIALAVDGAGNLFIADYSAYRVRMVSATTGTIQTIAGNGIAGYSGDGGPATSAMLSGPRALAVDASGNILVADFWNRVIRVLRPVE